MSGLRITANTLSVTTGNEGIRTLLTCLVPALVRVAPEHRYRLICSRANLALFDQVGDDVERLVLPPARRRPWARIWHDQVTVPRLVAKDTDVLFTPSSVGSVLARVPQVVAVPAHLALPSVRREVPGARLSFVHRLYYGPIMRLSHSRAAAVTPISAYLSRHLVDETGLAPEKTEPILLGVDPIVPPAPRSDGRFALMVGTLWPYKNALTAVDAFALASRELEPGFRLVIAGRDPDGGQRRRLVERAGAMGVGDAVEVRGPVDQADLERLYGTATMVLMPSRAEGFGLPVLEAMARGVPVIASNRTALPEVVGDAGLLVDPDRPADLAARMVEVATDPALCERLAVAGRRRVASLSWDATASAYVKVFERVAR